MNFTYGLLCGIPIGGALIFLLFLKLWVEITVEIATVAQQSKATYERTRRTADEITRQILERKR